MAHHECKTGAPAAQRQERSSTRGPLPALILGRKTSHVPPTSAPHKSGLCRATQGGTLQDNLPPTDCLSYQIEFKKVTHTHTVLNMAVAVAHLY